MASPRPGTRAPPPEQNTRRRLYRNCCNFKKGSACTHLHIWRILLYSADEPPSLRGLVECDAVDGHVIGEYTEQNPEDWWQARFGQDPLWSGKKTRQR